MSIFFRGIKNASYLATGNAIAQVISIIGFVYIARKLGPNDYGIYVSIGAFVGLFEIFLFMGLNKTIIRESSKDISSMHIVLEKNIGLRNLLILIAITICLISSFFTPYELLTKVYIAIFSFQLTTTALKSFLSTIYQSIEKMQYLAVFGIVNRLIFVSASIFFLYSGFGLLALLLISLFSNFLTISINFIISRKFVKFNFFSKIKLNKSILKQALTFSILGFVIFLTTRIDLLMISLLGSEKNVGIYGIAYKITQQGITLRNISATAFFPIFIKKFHTSSINASKLLKFSLFFLAAIFILSVASTFFIEDLITFLFGIQYKASGKIFKTLVFYLAFAWSILPFTTAAQATHNEKYLLIIWSIAAGLNIPLNYLLFLKYGLIGIAYSTLIVNAVAFILISIIVLKVMKKQGYLK